MSALIEAARRLQSVLVRETAAARRASLSDLTALWEEKQDALAALVALEPQAVAMPEEASEDATLADPILGGAARAVLREMLAAAEENALVLGAVAGAMEAMQDRLRRDLAAAADPGTYGEAHGPRRRLRHSLAATINQTA